jgi:hypothetical protein
MLDEFREEMDVHESKTFEYIGLLARKVHNGRRWRACGSFAPS